ncbi:MAG: hypothetical protein E7316_01420 [Clostridiales bacterium]|nr:hypothetical protein [Clostridiales bacterium]
MSERNMGQVVPFRLSAGKMRRSAYEHRRRGHPMEAVELLRRAAQQEDTPAGWLHLAEELRRLGCYEQASVLLYRMLAHPDVPILTWMELARAQAALGRTEAAVDSLYHYLNEDPYSDIADEARAMLGQLEETEAPEEAFRLSLLVRRGLTAWRAGRQQLGERRLRRAIRMAKRPVRLYITMALLMMAENRFANAAKCLAAALRQEPDNARAACMLCVAVNAMGRRRAALGLLRQAQGLCHTAEGEELFFTAAWTLSAHRQREEFLLARHRQQPCRIVLMHHLADLAWEKGEAQQAVQWWQRVLRLDPTDVRASALVRWSRDHGDGLLPPMGMLPNVESKTMLQGLLQAEAQHLSPEEMLIPGTDCRTAVDWCFTVSSMGIQQKCLEMLSAQDTPVIRQYLKELLTSPTVHQEIRHRVMLHLAQLGEHGPLNVLMGQRMTMAECAPMPQGKKHLWRAFLPRLLEETRRHRQSETIVEFAAELWPLLSPQQQHEAAGMDGYLWVKAVEILYLRLTEQDGAAARAVRHMPVSMRKVSRVLRKIARRMEHDINTEE